MAQTIQIKRSSSSNAPSSSLAAGELAYAATGSVSRLFIGHPDGTTGNLVIGGKEYVDTLNAATDANTASTLVLRDASGDFSAGTITATFSGNITGDVTGNADTATSWATARDLSLTGDGTATLSGVDGTANVSAALTLATVNSNVGSFGSSTAIPVLTVNAKGLVTAATTASITTSLTLQSDDAVNNTVDLATDTLKILGGTGITTSNSGDDVTISGDDATTSTKGIASFNSTNFSVSSGAVSTTDITAASDSGSAAVTNGGTLTFSGTTNEIETSATGTTVTFGLPSDVTVANDLNVGGNTVITGNLTVNGTTTTVNSNTVSVGDNIIVLNGDETGTPSQDAGIEVERGTSSNVALRWYETTDNWQVTTDGSTYSNILTAANFETNITTIDGGTF